MSTITNIDQITYYRVQILKLVAQLETLTGLLWHEMTNKCSPWIDGVDDESCFWDAVDNRKDWVLKSMYRHYCNRVDELLAAENRKEGI